ncbi:MAG: ATP synthase F1 subunit delta [Candidatus Omnitrophica bacterium CG11_big_fil_rev_8_21_14_0_20_42_13]|uniref:ATP synthase subunit delta n=1 Tax=Candidatus Ghiorseimicrobium undicola TaxID=1974746 RepID=A0A2H0LVT6_9BACT|nr:MAG: ATP synthase F1 subunit delta [Candidatus Omnitrophica bacterium CG11_big_fil_rev_8_21_14_0_20_42_13]
MINEEICTKYARAVLELAIEANAVEKTQKELLLFSGLLKHHSDILRFLEHPSVLSDNKKDLLDEIFKTADCSGFFTNFIRLLVKKHQISLIGCIYDIYADFALMREKKLEVSVESAHPLSAELKQQIEEKLLSIYKKAVHMRVDIAPDLIAGLKLRVGDTVYDLSLKSQLKNMQEHLI